MPDPRMWLHERMLPRGGAALLIGAGLGEDHLAAECWRKWTAQRDLDDVSWAEHRILAHIAPRMAVIAPDCPYRPRVEGLAKADWTRSQLILRASSRAVALLREHGIEVMLLKGGALQAAVPEAGVRVSGDLDILVPRARFADAVRVLYVAGWRSKDSVEYACARWHFASGTNLRKAPLGDIDVHHQPVHGVMRPEAVLEALWRRAGEGHFHGQEVRLPALEDLAVIAAAHGLRACSESPWGFVWLFDLDAVLRDPRIDPDLLVQSASELEVLPAVQAGVAALHRIRPSPASRQALTCLMSARAGAGAWARFLLDSLPVKWSKPLTSIVERVRPQRRSGRERDVVPRIRPLKWAGRAGVNVSFERMADQPFVRQELKLPALPATCSALVVELCCQPGAVSRRRFDVAVDGRIVGRISLRVPRNGRDWQSFRCRIPLTVPGAAGRLSIESLGQFSVMSGASVETVERARALPFSVLSLTAL